MGKNVSDKGEEENTSFKILPETSPIACNNSKGSCDGQELDKEVSPENCFRTFSLSQ